MVSEYVMPHAPDTQSKRIHKTRIMAIPLIRSLVVGYATVCVLYMWSLRALVMVGVPVGGWVVWSRASSTNPRRRQDFRDCTLCCLLPYFLLVALIYAWVGSVASNEEWGLRIADSPVNRSSCSRTEGQSELPYHPAGYVVWSPDVYETLVDENGKFVAQSLCALPKGSRWADATNEMPQGYMADIFGYADLTRPCNVADSACDGLASNLPQDYPDLGRGLRVGKYGNSLANDLALCQGVVPLVNSQGVSGTGLEICAQCMHPRPEHCLAYDGELMCFICPGGYFAAESVPDVVTMRTFSKMAIIMAVLLLLTTCYAFPPVFKKRSGYSPLF